MNTNHRNGVQEVIALARRAQVRLVRVLYSLVTVIIFIVSPLTLKFLSPASLATVTYDVIQAALTVIWCISMATLFVDVVLIRRRYHEQFARMQLAPLRVFHLCVVLGALASSVGIIVTFTNPWTTLLSRWQWDLVIGALLVLAGAAAIVTFGWGRPQISKGEAA